MCLLLNEKLTQEFIENNKGKVTVWKIYIRYKPFLKRSEPPYEVKDGIEEVVNEDFKLASIYYDAYNSNMFGDIISSRGSKQIRFGQNIDDDYSFEDKVYINKGIHVYLDKEEAEKD